MPHDPITFTVTDPRGFDGDPYEVAQRATLQAQAVARVLATCLMTANLMARNAEMERQLSAGKEADASAWEDSVPARMYARLHRDAKTIERALAALTKAAGFNPKKDR